MKDKSKNWGGKRLGAGQPKKEPTKLVNFRYNQDKIEKLRNIFTSEEINSELKNTLNRLYNENLSKD